MTDTHPSTQSQPSVAERFEPARAVLRPQACDERAGCWVKIGIEGCDKVGSGSNHCMACGGVIKVAGLETAHLRVLDRICRAWRMEGHAKMKTVS